MQANSELKRFLNQQACNNLHIFSELSYSTWQHAIYHPTKQTITPRKPRPSKPIQATTSDQVFYYYLNLLPSQAIKKFHSFKLPIQSWIMQEFHKKSITNSDQAVKKLTHILNKY